jgi:hypothetical protein
MCHHSLQGKIPQLIVRCCKRVKVLERQVGWGKVLADELVDYSTHAPGRKKSNVTDLICNPIVFSK